MSLTYLNITISNPKDPKKSHDRRFLIDSGAVFSVVDSEILHKIGIIADQKETFILANGEEIVKEVGEAVFQYGEHHRTSPVVFGEPDIFLLGATALEAMGLILDPINRQLKKLPMII